MTPPGEAVKVVNTPVGPLTLVAERGHLIRIEYGETRASHGYSQAVDEALRQLGEYFTGRRQQFDLAIHPEGTEFQRSVWAALTRIPYGRTISYGQLATMAGRSRAAQAAGQAAGRNPLPIVIPCHRVIAADGSLGGYSGGVEKKQQLLTLEGAWDRGR